MSNSALTLEHKRRRRQLYSLTSSGLGALAAGPPSHGISLFGLVYIIPRLVYSAIRKRKASKALSANGIKKLKHSVGDFVVPLISGTASGTLGGLADGASALHDAALSHAAQQTVHDHIASSSITDITTSNGIQGPVSHEHLRALVTGGTDTFNAHFEALVDPESASASANHLWEDGYNNISQHLRDAFTAVSNMDNNPETLLSDKFLKAVGQGVAGTFIGESVGAAVDVSAKKISGGIRYLINIPMKDGSVFSSTVTLSHV